MNECFILTRAALVIKILFLLFPKLIKGTYTAYSVISEIYLILLHMV